MKTIEEKAKAYAADNGTATVFYKPDVRFDISKKIEQAYLAGAAEALAGQWRRVEDELPKEHDEVVVIFTHSYRPFITENTVAYWYGEDWYTIDGEHLRPTHWMPIPESPKPEKK